MLELGSWQTHAMDIADMESKDWGRIDLQADSWLQKAPSAGLHGKPKNFEEKTA